MNDPVYTPRPVPDDLAPYVRALWYLEAPSTRRYEKILPSPNAHLIVNLGEPYRQLARGESATGVELVGAFVAGVQTQYLVNENPTALRMLVAQFSAEGVGMFAHADPALLVDEVLPADQLVPGVEALVSRGRRGAEVDVLLDELVTLLREARHGSTPDGVVTRVRGALEDARPALIARLALDEGLSPRALTARFARACGLTPKRFADVARFDAMLSSLAGRDSLPSWTDLVAEYGYYDQPHITRAFTRFAGSPPAAFVRDLREFGLEYATFVPLDHVAHS